MKFEYMVAKRFLMPKRRTLFQTIIIIISILGVLIGVATILIVISVMGGFHKDLRDKILGTNAHIAVMKYFNEPVTGYDSLMTVIEDTPRVNGVSPFVYTKVMLNHENYVDGIVLRGVDSKTLSDVSNIEEKIKYGDFNLTDEEEPEIVIGSILANNLRIHTGDKLAVFSTANFTSTPMGNIPEVEEFKVSGIFEAGMFEYDASLAYVSLASAQRLVGMNEAVSGIEVKVKDIYRAPQIAEEIEEKIGFPYKTTNWIRMNRSLFAALKLEKIVMFIILTLIIVVAAFNIIGTLIMIVIRKTKDIGILKSMGASSKQIMNIFMLQGVIIGAIGTGLGVVVGYIVCFLLGKYKFISLPSDVYFIDTLPVNMVWHDFLLVAISAIVISFAATIYPAIKAAKLDPVQAIRYE